MQESAKTLRELAQKLRKLASEYSVAKPQTLDPTKVRDFLIFFGRGGNKHGN